MLLSQPVVNFTLPEILSAAETVLQARPDPLPAYRLLNEVLRMPLSDTELRKAQASAGQSKWVKQLEGSQHADGSWGRFHSQDTKQKTVFRTTEEAIDRAFSLGLESSHPVLTRAAGYIEKVLTGRAHITDRAEKSTSWPVLIRFILEGRLAQIEPANPILKVGRQCLVEVADQAFSSGQYNLADEADAYSKLTNTHVPKGFIESQHALWILSSYPLPGLLDHQLMEWVWNKPDGIRYLRAALSDLQPRRIAYWLRSMNILSRFTSWRIVCGELLNRLWDQRDKQGYWDFGSQIAWCGDFPMSENWKTSLKRKIDYTTCMLVIMRRWFDA